MVKKEFFRYFAVQLSTRGQKKPALLLYETSGYMLNAQGGGDVQGILDHKCLLQISTHKTTLAKFL